MIVRILGDGQYRLDDADIATVEKADDAVESTVAAGDDAAFAQALAGLIATIRRVGAPVPHDEFTTSDVIVPDADTSLPDAVAMGAAAGEGLIPS